MKTDAIGADLPTYSGPTLSHAHLSWALSFTLPILQPRKWGSTAGTGTPLSASLAVVSCPARGFRSPSLGSFCGLQASSPEMMSNNTVTLGTKVQGLSQRPPTPRPGITETSRGEGMLPQQVHSEGRGETPTDPGMPKEGGGGRM